VRCPAALSRIRGMGWSMPPVAGFKHKQFIAKIHQLNELRDFSLFLQQFQKMCRAKTCDSGLVALP
jgi:hypothetical protein